MTESGEFAMWLAAGLASIGLLFGPMTTALARRISGRVGDAPQLRAELDDLRAQLNELYERDARMNELEERLDFAERLLAQQREPQQIRAEPPGMSP